MFHVCGIGVWLQPATGGVDTVQPPRSEFFCCCIVLYLSLLPLLLLPWLPFITSGYTQVPHSPTSFSFFFFLLLLLLFGGCLSELLFFGYTKVGPSPSSSSSSPPPAPPPSAAGGLVCDIIICTLYFVVIVLCTFEVIIVLCTFVVIVLCTLKLFIIVLLLIFYSKLFVYFCVFLSTSELIKVLPSYLCFTQKDDNIYFLSPPVVILVEGLRLIYIYIYTIL